jgi:chromosome partitioning protein
MKIVSFFNVKGGVGKTTLTILTSMALSKEGRRVLIIDADTQANLTQFVYKITHNDKTMFHGLADNLLAEEMVIESPMEKYKNIDIIPSDLSLSVLSEYLTTKVNRERSVWRWFKNNVGFLRKYDYIFIDLSPSYDLVARNFMIVSDSIITPIAYQNIASIRGCELFYQKYNKDLEEMEIQTSANRAVIINSYTNCNLSTGKVFDMKLSEFEDIKNDLLDSKLSDTTVVKNAILNRLDIEDYCKKIRKNHKIKYEFRNVLNELIEKEIL